MRFGRLMFFGVVMASGMAGLVGRGTGRVEAMDRTMQEPGQAALPGVATLQVYSRETLVDVVVEDAKGQPVQGLQQLDFTVEEDGKAQPIWSFQEFGRDMPAAQRVLAKLPANVYTNLQPTSGPLNILLLDYVSSLGRGDRIFVMNEAAKYVKDMPAGTQVAVLGLSTRMVVLQGPTSDPALLLKALNIPLKGFGVMADPCGTQYFVDRAILDQLNQVTSYVSGIKGRKNLIWIGPGIPTIVFPDGAFAQAASAGNALCIPSLAKELRLAYDRLAAAQVAVYPVDPREVGDLGKSQLAMEAVAEATGGEAFYESNDLKGLLAKAVDHGADYYTLSYAPDSFAYDGRYHAISIKVDRPGVRLVYRKGYSAEDTSPKASNGPTLMQVAMEQGAPTATQLLFDVRVQPSPVSGDDPAKAGTDRRALGLAGKASLRYDVLFALPASQIAFGDGVDGTHSGSLEFDVAAYNADGKRVNLVSQTLKLPLTQEEYGAFVKTPFKFFQQIDLPPGALFVRVGILDGVSNKVGTMEIPVTVAKGPVAGK